MGGVCEMYKIEIIFGFNLFFFNKVDGVWFSWFWFLCLSMCGLGWRIKGCICINFVFLNGGKFCSGYNYF